MAQNYTEQLRKDNVRDAIYEDLQNNCEVLRTSWSGNAFPANPKVGQPCYRVDEDKLYYWDGYKWSQKGGGGSAELKTMELAAATSERVSITLEGARCLDKNMMFVFVDKIAQDPSTYSMNDDGTVVNFNPAIPANAAVTLRWFDTDVGTFDTAIFASDAEFAAGELTNKAPNVKQVHSFGDQIQTSNANYVKSELQSNLLNYTTNRILEIPQDIKLELNNGTLTLKAGSKVYVPNGPGVFDAVTVPNDVVFHSGTIGSATGTFTLFCNSSGGFGLRSGTTTCASGTTNPGSGYAVWYDTTNNNIKYSENADGTFGSGRYSFPIGIYYRENGNAVSIGQVFNGFGYIGSTVFALPGVKVQIPNGRNEDGTCKSIVTTTTEVNIFSPGLGTTNYYNIDVWLRSNGTLTATDMYYYDSNKNQIVHSTRNKSYTDICIATFNWVNERIESWKSYTVDSVANSNASNFSQSGRSYLSGLGMPSSRYINLTLGASGSTYTAPANGYVAVGGPCSGYLSLYNATGKLISMVVPDNGNYQYARTFVPVSKGNVFGVDYAGLTVDNFRFIYAEGESNV